MNDSPTVLERVQTARGELVLRRSGPHLEIISNGVFLMDTSDGTSERLLIRAALDRCPAPAPALLIGGLGVGFSLAEAASLPGLAAIDVVEIEPTVIEWHARHLKHITGEAMADPRVRVIEADLVRWLEQTTDRYDALCLDTDNGPGWLVFDSNATLYTPDGLDLARRCLTPGGVLAVWSARRDLSFEERLHARFGAFEMLETEVGRGAPDVVYLARRRP